GNSPKRAESTHQDDADPTHLWRQRKLQGLAIADGYYGLGPLYQKSYERLSRCGEYLEFGVHELLDGTKHRELVRIVRCRDRVCPSCQKINSLVLFGHLSEVVCEVVRRRPKDQTLLVTLTTRNVSGEALSGEVDRQLEAFRKLIRRQAVARVVT